VVIHAADGTPAVRLFVDETVAVVVFAVATLIGYGTATTACVYNPFVDVPVTVLIHSVAFLDGLLPTFTAGVQDPLVDGLITVIVDAVTDLIAGDALVTILGQPFVY